MNLEALRTALEKYHRKKWFPQAEPDPLEQWADYATEATVQDLVSVWEQTGERSLLSIAYYIYSTDYRLSLKDVLKDLDVPTELNYFWTFD